MDKVWRHGQKEKNMIDIMFMEESIQYTTLYRLIEAHIKGNLSKKYFRKRKM
jgi:hypothetical protein